MAQDNNIKMSLQLVERLADNSIHYLPLVDIVSVPAQSGAQYAVIDIATGKSPEGLRVKRRGSSLLVETEDDLVLVEVVDFYEEADAVFIPQAELDGTALAGEFVTSNTPSIDTAANGEELIWQGSSGSESPTPTYLGLGALGLGGLAIAASGSNGGGSSGGGASDGGTPGGPDPVLNTVAGVIVGGPVIEGNDLRVEVYQADGVTRLGEAQVNADGSFSIAVGSYLGVVIARVVNGGSGADYLDEATQVGKDLNAELFAMEVVTEPNSTVNVNLNVLSTLAYHKVQEEASSGAPMGSMVESINKGIADLFGLPSLHGFEVVPTNGGRFNSDDGLSAGEMYGAVLAALSGSDAQNGGDSQQTINDLLAGLTVSNGTAVLSESAQGIVVQGAEFTSAQTGDSLAGTVPGIIDTFAPKFTSGVTASAIDENSASGQTVYTAVASDAGRVTYRLKPVDDHAAFTIDTITGAVTLAGNPDYETKPSYSFTVVATDAAGNSREQSVTLGINNLDEVAPTFTSGSIATAIDENSGAGQAVYTATSTDVADVSTGRTSYSLKSGGDASLFSINAATGVVTLTGNPDYETKPSYSFTVVATDAAGNSREQSVTLGINNLDEVAPTFTSGSIATAIDENSGAGQAVYTATSTDVADVSTGRTSYSLKSGGDASLFSINAATGVVTLIGNPDYETKPSYSFTVVATDAAGNSREQPVTLGINNLDEVAPTFTSGSTATAIDENSGAGQAVYTATSTDVADVSTGRTSYSLKSGGDASLFSINAATGVVTLIGNPDYETKPSYSFTVVATDAVGNSREQSVTLGINNLDEVAPTFTSGSIATAIDENSGAGQAVYTATSTDVADVSTGRTSYSLKSGGDASLFSINAATGVVTLIGNPDYETKPSYSFTVVATDAVGNSREQSVTLGINNLDDTAPMITSGATATAVNENSGAGQVVYTVTSSDDADVVSGPTRYSLKTGDDSAWFSIDAATGAVTLLDNPDYETKANYSFTVVATDAANNASEQTVTLAINDLEDETAPTVSDIAISSATGVQNNTLNEGDVVSVTVNMDEATLVDTTSGIPRVALNIGGSTVYAQYVSGSGSSALVFQYTILAGQNDANGISLDANALQANGGTLRDAAGNAANLAYGAVADNPNYQVDTSAPFVNITSSSLSNDSTPVVSGTAEAGATITVVIAGATYVTTATGGVWSIDTGVAIPNSGTLNINANGNNSVSVTATDAANNTSTAVTQTLVVDTTAPAVAITSQALSNDSTPVVSGTAEAGATITAVVAGATYVTTATGGVWSIDTGTAIPDSGTLNINANGNNSVSVTATDAANNTGTAVTQTLVVDTTAPAVAITSQALSNDSTPVVSGTAEAGATITVVIAGATYVTTATGGVWSIDTGVAIPNSGTLNINANGNNSVSGTATDAANNTSTAVTQTLVVDTTAPAVAITSQALSNDSTPVVSGTAEAGATITAVVAGATYVTTATGGVWSIDTGTAIPDSGTLNINANGNNSVSVTATDAANNTGTAVTQTLVVDTTAPAVAITSQALSNDSTPVVSGTAEAGATITAVIAGATYVTTATGGVWSIDTGTAIPDSGTLNINANGNNSVSITATDAANNTSSAVTQTLVVDTTAPAVAITSQALSNDSTPVVSGTAEAGATITAVIAGATYVTTATGGVWSIDTGTAIPDNGTLNINANGNNSISVTATDAANNTGTAVTQTLVVDTAAPILSSSTPMDNAPTVAVGADIVLTFSESVLAGSGNIVIANANDSSDTRTIAVTDSQVTINGNTVTIDPIADLQAGSSYYVQIASGALTDLAGNAYAGISDPTALNFETATAPSTDTDVVVFDLVQGVSSDHSNRTFDANTSYTIYIRVDSNSSTLSTAANGPGSWGKWLGANNLGADDKIVLVGSGSPVKGKNGGNVAVLSVGQSFSSTYVLWCSTRQYGATLQQTGLIRRNEGAWLDLWDGGWDANPNVGSVLNDVYRTNMPAGVLTSQGLA
ncbi:beta strand repeat-containing protein [Vreelandella sp.]|uniref:beta strand repeat-containing protein n=1 Tax=Vreelandella sp. TaxID=3137778 RepID=UPI003BA9DBE7